MCSAHPTYTLSWREKERERERGEERLYHMWPVGASTHAISGKILGGCPQWPHGGVHWEAQKKMARKK